MVQAQQKWTITPVAECRRLSRIAVFQDHDRRHRPRARGDGGRASSWSLPAFTGGAGTTVAHRSAHRRHVSRDAEGGAELEGTAGALRRRQQHADARQVQRRQRSSALAAQDAMIEPLSHAVAAIASGRRSARCSAADRSYWRAPAQPAAPGARSGADAGASDDRPPKRPTPTGSCSAGWSSSRFACRANSPTAPCRRPSRTDTSRISSPSSRTTATR